MKKLLGISILAATLASTAVFAGPQGGKGPKASPSIPMILVADSANQGFAGQSYNIAAYLMANLIGSHNTGFRSFHVNGKGNMSLEFDAALDQAQKGTVVESALGFVRVVNNNNGFSGLDIKPGKGQTLFVLTGISPTKDNDKVFTVVAVANGNVINLRKGPDADKVVAAKLLKAKHEAQSKPAVAKLA